MFRTDSNPDVEPNTPDDEHSRKGRMIADVMNKAIHAYDADARKDSDEKKKEEEKKDADAGEKIDKILACLDSILADSAKLHSRLDSIEKTRADGAEAAMLDKKRKKDGEEEVEEKGDPKEMKADTFKLDSNGRAVRYDRTASDENRDALSAVQSRADQACSAWGNAVERPFDDEPVDSYRRRTARRHQKYSPRWKEVDFKTLAGPGLAVATDDVFTDSIAASTSNDTFSGTGNLYPIRRVDPLTGHRITEWRGDPMAWMQQFTGQRRLARFNLNAGKK